MNGTEHAAQSKSIAQLAFSSTMHTAVQARHPGPPAAGPAGLTRVLVLGLLQLTLGPWVALFLCFPAMADFRMGVSYTSQLALSLV